MKELLLSFTEEDYNVLIDAASHYKLTIEDFLLKQAKTVIRLAKLRKQFEGLPWEVQWNDTEPL